MIDHSTSSTISRLWQERQIFDRPKNKKNKNERRHRPTSFWFLKSGTHSLMRFHLVFVVFFREGAAGPPCVLMMFFGNPEIVCLCIRWRILSTTFFFHVLKSIENTPKIGKEVKGTKGTSNSRRLLLPIYLFIFPTYIRERKGEDRRDKWEPKVRHRTEKAIHQCEGLNSCLTISGRD